ncbi:MAG: transcriptional regulator, TetR family [Actinomycetia bacterium]|nr:transcriptional regulator, TetR family [Actinomycetes bacterium]
MSGMAKTDVDAASLPETTRPRGRPRAADREPLILEAANQLLDEVGYDHLRVQDVADRARVGLATIYRRWPTKQALVIAAMRRAKAEVVRPETDDPRADLEAYFREMANQILGPKSCFVVGFVTALRNDPELARVFRESLLAEMRDQLRRPIARVVGDDDPDLDLRVDIAPAFLIFRTLIDDRAVDPDELALRLCALVVGSVTH